MRKLSVFNSISLDGYFTGKKGDLSWAHDSSEDPETQEFVKNNARGEGILVFGRVTYDMMVSYWPTPQAHEAMPVVAERMNAREKIVFSRKLEKVSWQNTRLISGGDLISEMTKLKKEAGPDMTILGSGQIVAQLTQHGLIDEYRFLVLPVILGDGRTLFEGCEKPRSLKLVETRVFKTGKVFLHYCLD